MPSRPPCQIETAQFIEEQQCRLQKSRDDMSLKCSYDKHLRSSAGLGSSARSGASLSTGLGICARIVDIWVARHGPRLQTCVCDAGFAAICEMTCYVRALC